MKTYTYKAKDGTTITGIPEDIKPDDPRLFDFYKQMKSAGQTTATFAPGPIVLSPEGAAAVDPEAVSAPPMGEEAMLAAAARQAPTPGAPPRPQGRVQDLVMSEPRYKDLPTAMGTMGAVVRGAGPVAAGAALGAGAGSIIPGVGTAAGALAGGGAMGAAQFVGDPLVMGINKLFGTKYTLPTDAIEDLFTRIGVAEPKTEAEKLIQAVSSGTASAGSGVMLGQALQAGAGLAPATRDLVGKALASGPLQQLLGGAGGAAGSTIAAQQGAGPLAQFGAGMAGSVLGSAAGNAMSLQPGAVNPMQTTVDDSARFRTQLMTSDVFPTETFAARTGQALGEKIPVIGTGPVRAAQQADRIKDVKDLLRQFGADDAASASDDVMADLLTKRSGNIERWKGMKDKVIDELSIPKVADDGDTITSAAVSVGGKIFEGPSHADAVQQATEQGLIKYTDRGYVDADGDLMRPGWSDLFRTKKGKLINRFQADELFDTTASENMSRTVPMTATTKKIDDSITFLNQLKTEQVKPVIAVLEDWKQAIQGQDLKNIELLRKQIGETFTAPEMASVRSTGERVLSDIYGAVKQDMTEYIAEKGGQQALNKWQIANKELSKMMGDLDLTILKTTLEKGVDRPEVVKNMLFNKDRSVIQSLYKNLTAKGREAGRAAIMQEIGKKIGEEASPERFLTELRKMKAGGDPVGVFFSGDDLKAVEGLTRVLKATSRASQAGLNPPTGVQAVIPLSIIGMGGGSVALEKLYGQGLPGLLASVGAVGLAGGGARLYESPAVRNILMKLPTVKPGSVEEAALFKRLLEASQAVKAKESEAR